MINIQHMSCVTLQKGMETQKLGDGKVETTYGGRYRRRYRYRRQGACNVSVSVSCGVVTGDHHSPPLFQQVRYVPVVSAWGEMMF